MFEAKIIADSVCRGHRLTTMQLTHPRMVHAEFNTHCMFARNAASTRAIPFSKMVQKVIEDPFIPIHWGINQPGMQAFSELQGTDREVAILKWLEARDNAIRSARELSSVDGLNVHKQIVNRLLEPWMWITVCVTGDDGAWSNYFALRCHPDAEPSIQKQAYMAQKLYFTHTPEPIDYRHWHLPYIRPGEAEQILTWAEGHGIAYPGEDWLEVVKVSVGRCARTSYMTQEGKRDFAEDVKLHDRLLTHKPMHASPFEHVCQAMQDHARRGKYTGWMAYRHQLPQEYITNFQPNHPDLIGEPDGQSSEQEAGGGVQ